MTSAKRIISFFICLFVISIFLFVGGCVSVHPRTLGVRQTAENIADSVVYVGGFLTPLYDSVVVNILGVDVLLRDYPDLINCIEIAYGVEYVSNSELFFNGSALDWIFDREDYNKRLAFLDAAMRARDDGLISVEEYLIIINLGKSASAPSL